MQRSIIIALFSLFPLGFWGQYQIEYIALSPSLTKETNAKKTVRDSLAVLKEIARIENTLIASGYLTANAEEITFEGKKSQAIFYVGPLFKWANISKGNVDDEALIKSGYRNKILDKKPITPKGIANLHQSLITHYENNGYPFISSRITNISYVDSSKLTGSLKIDKGPLIKIDSVVILGNAKISKTYMVNYIGIKEGDIYDQSKLNAVDNRLKELAFIKPFKGAQVGFTRKHTKLYLYLNHRNASKFNGILGVLPDNVTGKITITGDAKVALRNAFKKGETVSLNWRKLQDLTQDVDVKLNYPFLLQSPLGIDGRIKLFKKDTSYLELNQRLGLQYLFSGGNYLMVFFDNYSSNLINSGKYASSTVLPDFADVRFRQYGLSARKAKLDYRINPRKGYELEFTGSVGTKVITKNPELNEVLYQNVELNSLQFKLQSELGWFIPLVNRSTIYMKVNSGYLVNDNVFINELFRIGGLKTLRGFDEEGMNASLFGIATLEYRFLLEKNSNIYVFGDYAYYERTVQGEHVSDRPFGFGAGISFQTKPGIFSINYALGSQQGNPILFRAAKVHFGFVNYF